MRTMLVFLEEEDWCVCKGKGCSGSSRTEVVRLKLEVSPGDEDASQGFGGAPQQR